MPLFVSWLECIWRRCQLGNCWPHWKRGEKSKCMSTTPGRGAPGCQASTSRTSPPKWTEGFPTGGMFHWSLYSLICLGDLGVRLWFCEIVWNHSELFCAGRLEAILPGITLCRDVYEEGWQVGGNRSALTPAHGARRTNCCKWGVGRGREECPQEGFA